MAKPASKSVATPTAQPAAPTKQTTELPFTPFDIGGRTLKVCLDFNEMAAAESKFARQGHSCNLLFGFMNLSFATCRTIWACALQAYQPEIGFQEAVDMLTPGYAALASALFARELYRDLPSGVEAVAS